MKSTIQNTTMPKRNMLHKRRGFILMICFAAMIVVGVSTSVMLMTADLRGIYVNQMVATTNKDTELNQIGEDFLAGHVVDGEIKYEKYLCEVIYSTEPRGISGTQTEKEILNIYSVDDTQKEKRIMSVKKTRTDNILTDWIKYS